MNRSIGTALAAALLLASAPSWAQQAAAPGRSPAATMSAQAEAPWDPTGYWVSIIEEDGYLFRMVIPQRGQYSGIPITGQSRAFADAWSAARDEAASKQCEAYGAAIIMQVPERLHITWQDANTLEVQTDAGMQTRLLRFRATEAQRMASPSRQGNSMAQWMLYRGPRASGRGDHSRYGWLQVTTTQMLPGLLRKNGVPYSGGTEMKENWVFIREAGLLTVTTTLTDPMYLTGPYIYNSIFQKQRDGSDWAPSPCSLSH